MTDRQIAEAIIKHGGCKVRNPSCEECPLKDIYCNNKDGYNIGEAVEYAKKFLANEWTDLDITNLPPDILASEYEFQTLFSSGKWNTLHIPRGSKTEKINILKYAFTGQAKYRYRKIEKEPAVKESIESIILELSKYTLPLIELLRRCVQEAENIKTRESADIPKE